MSSAGVGFPNPSQILPKSFQTIWSDFFCLILPLDSKTTGRKLSTAPGTRRSTPIYIIVQCEKAFLIQVIIMSKQSKTNLTGWHRNTDLGCDLKTILRSDRRMKQGKDYQGVLRLDAEGDVDEYLTTDTHYTFVETRPWSMKRNPRVFNGKFISITRQEGGTLRPNVKPMPTGSHFSLERYAFGVYLELHKALEGLVGEK